MPEKIKVKDICEIAMINKTTFYNHYVDSAQLSDELEDAALERVILEFGEQDKIFEDLNAYIVAVFDSLERQASTLRLVFRGRQDTLCAKLEARLYSTYEQYAHDLDGSVRLSFAVGGFARVVRDYLFSPDKCDPVMLAEKTTSLLSDLLHRPNPIKGGAV